MPQELHSRLGEIWRLQESGARDAAERQCQELLEARPDCVEAWCALGRVLHDARRMDEAIESYGKGLAVNPDEPAALAGLGSALMAANRLEEAEGALSRAVSLSAEYASAHYDLGTLHMRRNQFQRAVRSFRHARRLQPGDKATAAALGWASLKTRETEQAIACFDAAVSMDPGDAAACHGMATALGHQGEATASVVWHWRAVALRPGSAYFASARLCAMQHDQNTSAGQLLEAHLDWAKSFAVSEAPGGHANDTNPDRALVVGYCSRDFYAHPVGRFMEPILAYHARSRVRSICYSDVEAPDHVTERLRAASGGWRPIAGLRDEEVARQIREDRVDILVDLAGHTAQHRLALFARKPAPVQVTYLGYPGTTGLAAMDYCLVDEVSAPPGSDGQFTEQPVRLDNGLCCFAGYPDAPAPTRLPALDKGYVTFGSLHKSIKINETVIGLWAAVLRAVPSSKLLLATAELTASVQSRLKRQFALRGVPASRLIFSRPSHSDDAHLRVYHDVDICLDTVPWCGHASACDALWMGVPMITLCGGRYAGRMTASVLSQLGLNNLIAGSPEQFSQIAVTLASELDKLASLRASLRQRFQNSSAGDGTKFTQALELAYRNMWRSWCERTPTKAPSLSAELAPSEAQV